MKKNIIFAGLVAVIAIVAASCNSTSKVDAPKARFTYDVDGMTVTFTNASKDAESYAWAFGDGETSTEKDPVHTYAEGGSYTVKLTVTNAGGEDSMTEDISLEKKLIVVDGNFDDWAGVPADLLAQASSDDKAKFAALYNMKWCTDADYIYFYLEFSAETYPTKDADGNDITGYMVDPIDIYMNVDADETTGSNSYLWENSAADILIEGFWNDKLETAGIYLFPSTADQTAWAWEDGGVVGSTSCCEPVILANGHKALEGKIIRAMLPLTIKGLKVGVFTSNTDWSESGSLPETILNDDGTTTTLPLLEVKLN